MAAGGHAARGSPMRDSFKLKKSVIPKARSSRRGTSPKMRSLMQVARPTMQTAAALLSPPSWLTLPQGPSAQRTRLRDDTFFEEIRFLCIRNEVSSSVRSGATLTRRDFWEFVRHDAFAFFDRDDLIYGHIRQAVYFSAGPGDFQRFDFGALSQGQTRILGSLADM